MRATSSRSRPGWPFRHALDVLFRDLHAVSCPRLPVQEVEYGILNLPRPGTPRLSAAACAQAWGRKSISMTRASPSACRQIAQ